MENPSSSVTPTPRGSGPYIPASTILPEITVKAIVLGVVLSVILSAANAYLGLLVGMTVSASIPAAVISMAVLRLFRQSNILENNIVQTSASAGESLAAGAIFTMPALIMMQIWGRFDYVETAIVTGLGGVIGVMFTIPLRRAMIVENPLQFPEGVATAEVLKVGQGGGSGIGQIISGGIIGAIFKLGDTGFRLWTGSVEYARYVGNTIAYIGTNVSPALVGVGYIVGLNIAVVLFLGSAINWFIVIPYLVATGAGPVAGSAVEVAGTLWSTQTRYLGVGAMLVGGLWALIRLSKSLVEGIRSSVRAYRSARGGDAVDRTDRDTPIQWVGIGLIVSAIPLFYVFHHFIDNAAIAAVMAGLMLVAGFLFSAVAAYMAGLVGSSNNPISGITISTILVSSLLLLLMMGSGNAQGAAAAIFIGAVVCCAAAIGGDNMQDLKAGYLLGATPYKQQIMQMIGVVAAALAMAPILNLLLDGYGFGPQTADRPNALQAPQATLMASVAQGVFFGGLPWDMVIAGMVIAVVVIIIDVILEKRGSAWKFPVLAFAVGIYLPLELMTPILLGGLIAWIAGRAYGKVQDQADGELEAPLTDARTTGERNGLLFAAGLITGEALLGIALAIPIAATENPDVLRLVETPVRTIGLILLAIVMFGLYRVASKPGRDLR
ncbi:MAG: oligopeptide transporter, OPT family [Acidobacteria bacterium]|nr:oligopeptide transporter, OPT family [Acidobacteriota bacterium]